MLNLLMSLSYQKLRDAKSIMLELNNHDSASRVDRITIGDGLPSKK
jgi:hypothetical protein